MIIIKIFVNYMKIIFNFFNSLNQSKYFAGIMMIVLNLGSKYITLELSETQDELFKNKIIRRFLVFTVVFVATRDIFVSLILTCIFILFSNYLFNDQSYFCIIPNKYKNINQVDTNKNITEKDIQDAIHTLKNAYYNQNKDN